jgi:4-amino-4-deoxy-L-arabinose transferase-like glycosyltransferase
MHEPGGLDVVRARLMLSRRSDGAKPRLRAEESAAGGSPDPVPWRVLGAVVLGLVAQRLLEARVAAPFGAVALWALAIGLLGWSHFRAEIGVARIPEPHHAAGGGDSVRTPLLLLGAVLVCGTFLTCRGGRFTGLNVALWLASIAVMMHALWPRGSAQRRRPVREAVAGARARLARRDLPFVVTPWLVCLVAVVLVSAFFRLHRIDSVPGEMISDHAEKLLDIRDVLDGTTPIFFARNAGREPMQFYLTAIVAKFLGFGPSFLSLKLLMALAGIGGLVFVSLLGKELGGRRVGLAAFLLCGIAYWPNVLGRIGLRLILAPCFAAATLYFVVRGIRTGDRRWFLAAGLALGFGLYGYTAIRIVPVVLLLALLLVLLHTAGRHDRRRVVRGMACLALVALVVAVPLMSYAADYPAQFGFRTLTRMTSLERPLPAPAAGILLGNLASALAMFFWSDGRIWAICVPNRPALDVVTAVTFLVGCALLVMRYARQRPWQDLFLLVSIPVLMLPSALSLAFPRENPSPSRAGCAVVPVFIVAAIGLEAVLSSLAARAGRRRRALSLVVGTLLLGAAVAENYNLVFHQYDRQYRLAAWNASEIGRVAGGFADSIGAPESVFVVGFPYWVDTRLVSFNAGFLRHDVGIWADQLDDTVQEKRAKLFVLHPADSASLKTLRWLYPSGSLSRRASATPGKDFLLYFVAADATPGAGAQETTTP